MILLNLIAQAADPTGGGWGDILATYGPFAPFAFLLLFILQLLWKDNKEKEGEIKRLSETAMEKVLPLVLDATRVLSDAIETIKHSRDLTVDTAKMASVMEDLIANLEGVKKAIRELQTTTTTTTTSPQRKRQPPKAPRTQ